MRHHHHAYADDVAVVICLNDCTEPIAVMDRGGALLYMDHHPCQDAACFEGERLDNPQREER